MTWVRMFLLLLVFATPALAQSPGSRDANYVLQELQKLAWQKGPGDGAIAGKATIKIPQGYAFLDERNTRRFIELMGNPPRDGHYMIAPASLDWFAVFSFDPIGYVKDDEKIDAEQLLKDLKSGDERGNEERQRLGMSPIYTDGWHVPPHYDSDSKRLEWGLRLRDEKGRTNVNYTSRILGRTGVMSAVLVTSPQTLNEDMKAFSGALKGYEFVSGERYAEFKSGDKIAEYGLAALVIGGAAAAAAKSGLLKSLGKFLWVIIGGAIAGGWSLLKRLLGRRDVPPPAPPSPGQQ
ncbi:MAG TPA: DUF2167 domain-containing protein [Burkholderiales bacterium]|nr:DUF2167 domain-containing protein [Burkholderiales bacterium]